MAAGKVNTPNLTVANILRIEYVFNCIRQSLKSMFYLVIGIRARKSKKRISIYVMGKIFVAFVDEVKNKWNYTSSPPYVFMTSTKRSSSLLVPLFFVSAFWFFSIRTKLFSSPSCQVSCSSLLSVLYCGDES